MRIATLLLALGIAGVCWPPLSAQKLGEVPRVAPSPEASRGVVLEWTSAEGKPYWYRLPKKMSATKPVNLVFMLHGTGLNHGWAFWNYPVKTGQFRGGDIVVSPDGLTPSGKTFNFVQGDKDGDQIAGLIKLFRQRFPVKNVYLYGHSQGAFFCFWFAGRHTALVDGIVAHAGNVLDVKHNDLARKKLGIAILHGKADAVVPVSCAHRSAKIYRDQGYKKVKLEIVEGLTEQSGHWPLPTQVAEMLAWLDQVCASTPSQALEVALAEIARDRPDFVVITEAVVTAGRLLKGYRGKDRDDLQARLAKLDGFVASTIAAQQGALTDAMGAATGGSFDPWMAHFRAVHPTCMTSKEWRKAMKPAIDDTRKHHKKVSAALRLLEKRSTGPALAKALKAWELSPLAPNIGDLSQKLHELTTTPPPGTRQKDIDRFRELAGPRERGEKEGRARAGTITADSATKFRAAHPALFPPTE